jgi:hypothetical protein
MSFEIKPATRVGISPLIVAYSESGCGKSYSSLLLARGLAGPTGKIVVADSESRRASLYADVIPGGFETFDLCAPFSPARYIEAIDTIETSGAAVGIVDSGSHEWEGPQGVLDMAGEIEQRSGKSGLHCWKTPKFEHAKFIQRLLRTKIPLIVCLRAKYKSRQQKDERGKTVIVKDEMTSPIQAEDFIFEATCHFEILQNHSIVLTKCSHPSLRDCFPKDRTTPIEIKHGALLAKWCAAPNAASYATPPPPQKPTDKSPEWKAAMLELWNLTAPVHRKSKKALSQWAWDEAIIGDTESLDELSTEELLKALARARKKMEAQDVPTP